MIAPLGQGALDVGSGTAVAGLYNAIERGIGLRIVADRSRMEKGYRFQSLVVRKALIDSGRVKTLADLKGLRVALLSNAGSPASALNEAAKKGGITFDDIEKVILIFPQQVPAFANGAIDASILVEPFTTLVTENGSAAVFSTTEDFVPSDQIGMTIFSEKFAKEKRDLGLRFIRAYVRAARDYNDAIKDGRFGDGPKGAALVKIMADNLKLKEEQVRKVWPAAIDPDARPHLPSLQRSLAFFKEHGFVKDAALQVENVLDMSFVEAAVKDLGPYVNAGD